MEQPKQVSAKSTGFLFSLFHYAESQIIVVNQAQTQHIQPQVIKKTGLEKERRIHAGTIYIEVEISHWAVNFF